MAVWAPSKWDGAELIDQGGHDLGLVAENLRDMERANRWLGGVWLTVRALDQLTRGLPAEASVRVLDVAAGDGFMARTIAAWGTKRGFAMEVTATDASTDAVSIAARGAPGPVALAITDARAQPFAAHSFDVCVCSLALHHFAAGDAVVMLGEMRRVSRLGVVVNDLVRSWPGYWGAWLFSRLLTTNPLTRNDAPLSVRRAYTPTEMASLAASAGMDSVSFFRLPFLRAAMTYRALP